MSNPRSARPLARMVRRGMMRALALIVATAGVLGAQQAPPKPNSASDWSAVDEALGRKGAMQPGEVMKYSFPRSDMQVTAAGVQLKPALALGSWLAFKRVPGGHAMAMGDLVLGEEEVGPVMRALQKGGVEQTALHNHVLHESPRVMYMHISAHGDAVTIARAVRAALSESHAPLGTPVGKLNGVVYQVTVPRRETIREARTEVPSSMGVATAINFQPTGGGKAAITGDFVMRGPEANAVIRTLLQGGIEVSALHSHMLTEEPRLFFMHFWANDDAVKLAGVLREALSHTNSMVAKR